MRLAVYTTLYPSAARPRHGIFVEQRLRRLVESGEIAASAIVPVPRCPPFDWFLREYLEQRKAPRAEYRHGVSVRFPRFPTWPMIGRSVNPFLMALGTRGAFARLLRESPDTAVIDAHFFYPDGIAAMLLGTWFRRPVVITARGSDVNVLAQSAIARCWMRWAAKRCAAIVAVSEALRQSMIGLGIDAAKITVLRNGVDLATFGAHDRMAVRRELGLDGTVLLCVGNLVPDKGQEHAIRALPELPAAHLVVIGEGPQEGPLRRLASELGVAARITWVGVVPQVELARYYAAADATVLMSAREGLPNVLLESMACGTPVVATNVGGVSEVVTAPESGLVLKEASSTALASAVRSLLGNPPDRERTRAYARRFDWQPTTRALIELYRAAAGPTPLAAPQGARS
jgi:glycosyltransferase involved in cell wall biosynthesis